jgi:CheY-like chemotaxis protein
LKLEELTLSVVTKAVDAYLELAYGSTAVTRDRPDRTLRADAMTEEILGLFQRESIAPAGKSPLSRFTMRLGNRNYPFMKLLMQEHIVPGEFYFAVDTHDEMDIKPDFPDYEAWAAVRRFNQELKRKIEDRFVAIGLPTAATIRALCAARRAEARPVAEHARILVVDDEVELADAVGEVLEAQGFRPHKVHDGPAALDAARRLRPEMILLDYELPEMDGLEVLRALREDPETRDIPVLLCTASKISVADMRKADAFLAKPFQEDLLLEMIQRVLGAGRPEASR